MASFKKIRRSIQYTLVYWFVRILITVSTAVPRNAWLAFCGWLGSLAYHFAGETRALTLRHLQMAFPLKSKSELKALAKRNFKMLGKNAGDILRCSKTIRSLPDIEKIMVTYGLENFEAASAKGKGIIFIASHLGAFDLQVTSMAMRGLRPNIIGTPLKDKRLNELLWRYRNAHGAIAIERGKETFRMIKVLKSGGSVALLIDQDTKVKNVFVDFFGMPAATPVGATILALKTGARVVPTYVYLDEDNIHQMYILPEIPMKITGDEEADLIYNTQLMTNQIEAWIRNHPDQWVWMHERWKTQSQASASIN